jgi:predicted ATPase
VEQARRIRRTRRAPTELMVSGFKSIGEPVRVTVRPLTLIAGTNSSGKSSFMQPFLMLKQTLEAPFDPGSLLLNGPNVKLTAWNQALSRQRSKATSQRELQISLALGDKRVSNIYTWSPSKGLELSESDYYEQGRPSRFRRGMSHAAVGEQLSNQDRRRFESFAKVYSSRGGQEIDDDTDEAVRLTYSVTRRQCFLVPTAKLTDRPGSTELPSAGRLGTSDYSQSLLSIIHVPGLRGNPERVYESSAVGRSFAGTADRYVASVIYDWQNGDERGKSKLASLGANLQRLGLTWKVEARQVDDVQVALRVGRMLFAQRGGAHDMVNIADVGFGVSQTLPVLVALLAAAPGQTVYLEQPEIHLHPRAQVELGHILVDAAQRGIRVIVETHSSLVLRAVQTDVAQGRIHPEDVGLNWFSRSPESGYTQIASTTPDYAGRFGDWPSDFDDVAEQADWNYVVSAEQVDIAMSEVDDDDN